MPSKLRNRIILFLLALTLTISLLPMAAVAEETIPETEPAPSENEVITDAQVTIDDILTYYLGTTDPTTEEINAAVEAMDAETLDAAYREIWVLEGELTTALDEGLVTEAEIEGLYERNPQFAEFADAIGLRVGYGAPVNVLNTITAIPNLTISDTKNTASYNAENETFQATVKNGVFDSVSNVISFKNTSSTSRILKCYCTTTDDGTDDGPEKFPKNGNLEFIIPGGETKTYTLTRNGGYRKTATVTLTNITFEKAPTSIDVTVDYDNTIGTVTDEKGNTVNIGVNKIDPVVGITLTAAPKDSTKTSFVGWTDGSGKLLTTDSSYSFKPSKAITVKAVFAEKGGNAVFGVGQKTTLRSGLAQDTVYGVTDIKFVTDDLAAANTFAADKNNSTYKYIVLLNDGILPASSYTIASDVTLMIPHNDEYLIEVDKYKDNTVPEYASSSNNNSTYVEPTAHRTLTMKEGSSIEVSGTLIVSGRMYSGRGSENSAGAPTGPVGFINMEDGSTITLNTNAYLKVWGYITGKGSVTANSGANVCELFQFTDFRGGTATSNMVGHTNRVFPLSQYYIQNIEVPLTLYSGAKDTVYSMAEISSTNMSTKFTFIGTTSDTAMFKLTDGYVVKRYDGSKDRLVVDIYGKLSVDPVTLKFGNNGLIDIIGGVAGVKTTIESQQYELPINSNISIRADGTAKSKITIKQNIAFLPSSELIIENGATCTLESGTSIFVYDVDNWGPYVMGDRKLKPVIYAPGKTYNRTEKDLVDAKIQVDGLLDASAGYIYTTYKDDPADPAKGGANISSTGTGQVKINKGTAPVTYQYINNSAYEPISIASARLKNDKTIWPNIPYAGPTVTNTYTYTDGRWVCETHTEVVDAAVAPTCTETGLTEGKHCSVCGTVTVAQQEVAALGHDYSATEYTWSEDGKTCTVTGECTRDASHTTTANATMTSAVTTPATCTAMGTTTYTATFGVEWAQTQTKEVQDVAALGHNYGETTYTWSDDNTTCTAKHVCANDANHVETAAGNVTSEITTPATCTVKGTTTYTAAFDVTWAQTQTKEVQDVAALGHTQGAAVEENRVEATLYADGSYDYVVYCTVCNAEISRQTIVIPATAVAQVDKQKFASVADALEAAPVNGKIIILSADADTPKFNKQVTVDKGTFTDYQIVLAEGWTAEVNDKGLWVVKKVTGEGKFHIWASNVNMGNNLDMLFAIPKSALADWTGCYAKIVRTFHGPNPDKASDLKIPLDQWQTLKQGDSEYYVITYGDFSAKEMCDTVTLTVYNSSDAPVSYPWTDSIRAYAMRIIQNPVNSAQATTAIDMLNFGAEAQKFFNYGVDKLANDLLTDTQKEGSTAQDINGSSSVEFRGFLTVTSHIQYAIGFTGQTKDMTATVTYTDHKGKDHKITGITSELLGEQLGFNIKDCLVVADARCPITITVYDANNSVYTTCQDSVEAYIYRMIQKENDSKKNVYAAFMKFADSAYAFLHLNDTPKEVAE